MQAVSQSRKQSRPAGTAKWTDHVTATLKPSAPVPPKGKLDSWKITSAKITYPKKHSKITFGTPYQPQGTITKNMKLNGHTATIEFQQDWSLDRNANLLHARKKANDHKQNKSIPNYGRIHH